LRRLSADDFPHESHYRILLKRPENLTEKQEIKLAELLRYDLKVVRSNLLKEDFHFFWEYISTSWAEKFLHSLPEKRTSFEPSKR